MRRLITCLVLLAVPLLAFGSARAQEEPTCADFETQEDAQEFYDEHKDDDPENPDPYDLDTDGDGQACEGLPTEGEPGPTPLPADAQACTDEVDDTFTDEDDTPSPGELDITRMAHDATAETVTYELTTDDNYDAAAISKIEWLLEFDGEEVHDDGAVVVHGDLSASVIDAQGSHVATATAVHDDDTDDLLVAFPRDALDELGVGSEYDYFVVTTESDEYRFDEGGPCTHVLSAAPTPTPGLETGTVVLDDSTIPVGGTLGGFAPDFRPDTEATVTVFSDPVVLGTVTVDASGDAQFSFTLPNTVTAGAHTVEVRGVGADGDVRVADASFTVVASAATANPAPIASPGAGGEGLPATGAGGLSRTVPAALILLVGGMALVTLMTSRRQAALATAPTRRLAQFCARCGKHLGRQAKFCPRCGRNAGDVL